MKTIASAIATLTLITALSGCIIRTRGNARGNGRRACPPAHHWDGYNCVHNGNGPKVRDHRR
jgi:hypothetical protein